MQKYTPLALVLLAVAGNVRAEVIHVNTAAEANQYLNNTPPTIIKFYDDGCSACTQIQGAYVELSNALPQYKFVEINMEQVQGVLPEGINGVPAFVFVIHGKQVGQLIGAAPNFKDDLTQAATNAFNGAAAGGAPVGDAAIGGALETQADAAKSEVRKDGQPVQPGATSQGILAKIIGFFGMILAKIRDLLVGIFNWFKGLFGR